MKKALTIVLALVMALSMSAMAFAADATADAEAILGEIADVAKENSAWDAVEGALTDVVAALEDKTADFADVEGEVVNLNTVLEDIGLPSVDGLVDSLKETIKGMYTGSEATVPATTEAAPIEDTGSTSVGIAAFAAISVAAAAAYVCTKKN